MPVLKPNELPPEIRQFYPHGVDDSVYIHKAIKKGSSTIVIFTGGKDVRKDIWKRSGKVWGVLPKRKKVKTGRSEHKERIRKYPKGTLWGHPVKVNK